MTLEEYKNQETPERMPDVVLQDGDYTLGMVYKLAGSVYRTSIYVEGFEHEYVLLNNETRLWSSDGEGNPISRSCFRLHKPLKQTT